VAVTLKNTSVPPGALAVTTRLEEQVNTIEGSTTVTVKLQELLLPQLSLAVTITMFVPTGKKLPLAGEELMFNGPHPPVAVISKNTYSPPFSAAVTVMFVEQFNTIGG
jgi:hypothetical protein